MKIEGRKLMAEGVFENLIWTVSRPLETFKGGTLSEF